MYKINNTNKHIFRTIDEAWIPMDEVNTDYQAYLKWVAEGNEAEEWEVE